MKRARDDLAPAPPGKRPAASASTRPAQQGQQAGHRLTTNDALTYLRDVKTRFQEKKEVYDTFLDIMKEFKAQRIDTAGVILRVKDLFRGHTELILGFNTFLPKGYEIELTPEEEEELSKPHPAGTGPLLSVNPPAVAATQAAAGGVLKQPVEFDQAINYVNKIKTRFHSDERVYKAFLEILNMYRKGHKNINNVYEEVAVLFRNHQDLLGEFTYFLPDNTPPHQAQNRRPPSRIITHQAGADDYTQQSSQLHSQQNQANKREEEEVGQKYGGKELQIFEKIKSRLRNREAYHDFLKCLNMFAQEIISKQELMMLVQDAIGRFPDLMAGFNEFMVRCETMELEGGVFKESKGGLNMKKMQQLSLREKYLTRPISDLDWTHAERCTTSYVKLPPGYPKLTCSGRTALGNSVLNDTWVSVTSGSEDYSFKLMRKNQYEEALFRCEDDRYDIDMVIEQIFSTLRAMRPIAEKIALLPADDKINFRLQDEPLNAIHHRTIERLYADQGPTLMELLKKNPTVAVPVVLQRLEQKEAELVKIREEMQVHWKKLFQANYHKSLDHRSFYFKQADKKNITPKVLLTEIKERSEKRVHDEASLAQLSSAMSRHGSATPDLEFDYSDRSVHESCYTIIRCALDEQTSADTRAHILDFWVKLVEPFFGLPQRVEDTSQPPSKPHSTRKSAPSRATPPTEEDINGSDTSDQEDEKEDEGEDFSVEAGKADHVAASEPAEESSDEAPGKVYEHCKPLAAQGVSAPTNNAHVIYGNDSFYYFFRYHQFLYERLSTAKKCCQWKDKPQFVQTGDRRKDLDEDAKAAQQEQAEHLHAEFMTMVRELIEGSLDASTFEDRCRALLGTNSYVLFTLDKLVARIVKHLQTMMQDELTCRLWELHKYESSRHNSAPDVYRTNSHVLMHDEHSFRIQLTEDDKLTLQLLPSDKSEVPAGFIPPVFQDYLNNLINTPGALPRPEGEEEYSPLYLGRNLKRVCHQLLGTDHNDEVGYSRVLETVAVKNGLECKISCTSYKVSYVLDTEDLLWRKPSPKRKHSDFYYSSGRRAHLFESWYNMRMQRMERGRGNMDHSATDALASIAAQEAEAMEMDIDAAPRHRGSRGGYSGSHGMADRDVY